MSKRDELIAVYTQDLKEKCGEKNPDVAFLTKVTVGLGPSIYNADASIALIRSDKYCFILF